MRTLQFYIGVFISMVSYTVLAQKIPLDTLVKTGVLPNGLKYYIRHNTEPQNNAVLYLINKVGSVLEDDDQQGLAHFMEHMNFNGTKNFPKNELVDYLQKAGITFGADLNAYTTFDETVYKLPIPTNNPVMLANGLAILRDWAQETTLDLEEIDKERGVVLEELRLRKGAAHRMSQQYFPMFLNHSRYSERLPIGKDDILKHFKQSTLKRFKEDWYRPDLQAVIVVGDIDVEETEKLIKEQFSSLKNPKSERKRIPYEIALNGENQFQIVADKEQGEVNLQILFKRKVKSLKTNQDYKEKLATSLLNLMLSSRREDCISKETNPAYLNMGISIQPLLGNVDMLAYNVIAKEGQLKESFFQTWRFIERIKKFGLTEEGLEIAKTTYLAGLERQFKEKEHMPSVNYAEEYQRLFLNGDAAPGIDWEYAFTKEKLIEISLDSINAIIKSYLEPINRDILLLSPISYKGKLPNAAQINDWIKEIALEKQQPFINETVNKPLLTSLHAPGKVSKREVFSDLGLTKITLSNGLKVWLKPTTFKNDEILFSGYSEGGTSLYNDETFYHAYNAAALISQMGLGDLNPTELRKVLTAKAVNVKSNITARTEVVQGSAAPKDFETALKLIYLKFTAPRKDTLLFKNIISKSKENIANRYTVPKNVFSDTISHVLGNYSYRSEPSTVSKVDGIDLDKAYTIYKERFGDASGFTFAFVGNFEVNHIIPLLEKYLGALPATFTKETARDLGTHIPEGEFVKKIYKGIENQAIVQLVASGNYNFSAKENMYLKALGNILKIRLLQTLRESEGEVYSPSVQTTFNKDPKNRFAIFVNFGCAPSNVDHLISLVKNEMLNMRFLGVTMEEIEKFKAAYNKEINLALKNNSFWMSYIIAQSQNKEDINEVSYVPQNLKSVTKEHLLQAAQVFFSNTNLISFELLPETYEN